MNISGLNQVKETTTTDGIVSTKYKEAVEAALKYCLTKLI